MNISFSWLKNHVAIPDGVSPESIAEKLKTSTVEVEGVVRSGQPLDNIVVGKVVSAVKHPNADSLQVCKVDVGSETLDIVCGGSNVAAGMFVVVAKNGSRVQWHGEGELVELKPTKIRGVESNGMICGADEVGLIARFPKKSEKEIVDLSGLKVKAGQPLVEVVGGGDAVLEIDNKSLSNRPDLWGHYGLAREVAVLTERDVRPYKTKSISKGSGVTLSVQVKDAKLCPRYQAVAMSGIVVEPSPAWLVERLTAIGVRSINNIVDALNYVMFDVGQPLHAFDARQFAKGKIVVRAAEAGETLLALDEKEYALTTEHLVIANDSKPMAIAGIMGGLASGVQTDTTTIIIESANFAATTIRKTSTKLGLRTDASARFEKSLDQNLTAIALEKAVELIAGMCKGAKVASKVVEAGGGKQAQPQLEIPVGFFEKKLGIVLSNKTIAATLSRLGFAVKDKSKYFLVTIPTWRAKDVHSAEDVVEEVVRIYGYDAIPTALPRFVAAPPEKNTLRQLERSVLDALVMGEAYNEVYNYSFVSERQIVELGESTEKYVALDNPLSKEKPYLRRSLILNLLENIAANSATRTEVKLVEIGKVFRQESPGFRSEGNGNELLPRQDTYVTAVFSQKKNSNPFATVRQAAEALQRVVGPALQIKPAKEGGVGRHPARQADLVYQGAGVGAVYELHPHVAKQFGLHDRVGVLKLNLSLIAEKGLSDKQKYTKVSAYPAVVRDIAILVKKETTYEQVAKAIRSTGNLLADVELFDVYEGNTVGKGYKSLAMHLTFVNTDRTLTSEEVDRAFATIVDTLQKKVQAEVRS